MKKFFVGAMLFALPMVASAANFAQSPIFLSKTPVIEGQKVHVYTIVSNDTATAFKGTVTISVDDVKIGNPAASLAAGATQTVSASWVPTAGDHTITASLVASNGTAVQQVSKTFTVEALPSPAPDTSNTASNIPANKTNGVQPSTGIQQSIGSVSPTAEKYFAPIFKVIDSGRVFAANQLNKGLEWSKKQVGAPVTSPTSAFIKTPDAATQNKTASGAWTIFATAVLYVLTVLLYVIGNAGFFYPLLAVLFFYVLWKLWRRYRRKH